MNIANFIKNKLDPPKTCSAVILAAGSSQRMGEDKTLMEFSDVPVIVRTIREFEKSELIQEIIVVTRPEKIEKIADLIRQYDFTKVSKVIAGGATRMESSLAGVSAVKKGVDLIAIHDAVRPFVTSKVIEDTVNAAIKFRAAVPGIPVVDTMKTTEDGFSTGSVDRERVIRVQTPQIFDADLIKGALTYVVKEKLAVTDDSSAVELLGYKVKIVEGDSDNIKLTTPFDIAIANSIIKNREG